MHISRLCRVLFFALLLSGMAITALSQKKPVKCDKSGVCVWALASGSRKVYHCPGSKWYGVGDGKPMIECDAIKAGYRPAYASCGAPCPH
jgi:hypothetical protein